MRIICPPVLVGDRICRIVSPIESLLEVEEWVGAWWEPSSVTVTTASHSPAAPVAQLTERGVPLTDCAPGPRPAEEEIQALMRANVTSATQPVSLDPENERRRNGARRKVYTGNSKFRKGRSAVAAEARADQRTAERSAERTVPRRRATDAVPPQGPTTP